MSEPPIWTAAELASDAEQAKAAFRKRRLREPLELYSRFFKLFAPIVAGMIDRLPGLTSAQAAAEAVAEIIADDDWRTAFRYLAAPPISEDDLKTLAETNLSAMALRSDEEQARRVREDSAASHRSASLPVVGRRSFAGRGRAASGPSRSAGTRDSDAGCRAEGR